MWEFTRFIWWMQTGRQMAANPQNKPIDLGCEYVGRPSPFIIRSTLRQSRPNKACFKCPSVRQSVRASTKCFFDFNVIWHVGSRWWVMHDGMQYDPIQGQGQGHEPSKLEIQSFSKAISSAIYNGSWQLTTDSKTRAHNLNFVGPDFFYICRSFCHVTLILALCVRCEESNVSPIRG